MSRPPRSIYGVDPRTVIRLVTVVVVFVPLFALFHEVLSAYVDLLTATGVPSSRELTLALLAAFSIFPPLMIAIRIADLLYDRYIDE
ncbi:hypothetical protein [Halococcus saccharolyticus]|uniref:Uncharacterized protein n=1 Tax=Halococcus saccharolyticus DSM 5350 TaxID=1227455 RepID=M0MPJ0_9EURY|nr:hypothetical protein [Halococcus saccharolyticus]EMA47546.1 hypothetical protein C449_01231 [Halococcus saccharolyticus DSM 5350]